VTNVGQREAYQRMAHVLCELLVRLRAVAWPRTMSVTCRSPKASSPM
jgi:hypothetical protein